VVNFEEVEEEDLVVGLVVVVHDVHCVVAVAVAVQAHCRFQDLLNQEVKPLS